MPPPPQPRLVGPEISSPTPGDRRLLGQRVAARRGDSLYFLEPTEIWAFQAAGAKTVVHAVGGRYDIELPLAEIERSFCRPLLRVQAQWLVNAALVRRLERISGQTTVFVGGGVGENAHGVRVPVARDHAPAVREALLAWSTGLRHGRSKPDTYDDPEYQEVALLCEPARSTGGAEVVESRERLGGTGGEAPENRLVPLGDAEGAAGLRQDFRRTEGH